jgi:hypothetical protein
LLSVQDQSLRLRRVGEIQALDQPRLEPDVGVSGLEHHHRPDRERQRNARQQTWDMIIIPDPPALEVGKLGFPLFDALKEVVEALLWYSQTSSSIPRLYLSSPKGEDPREWSPAEFSPFA